MERDQGRNARTRSEPPRSGDAASRIRKANVRAALFKKPEPIRIGRFILLERLGSGAMGEVYAAYDEQLDRKVALKLVRSTAEDSTRADERLLREAQTLAQLSHPNVVHVYEAGTHQGGVFIAMELIRGKTLTAWLDAAQELPRAERQRQILRQFIAAGRGLEAAHSAGLAHRDFKPDNVLVGDDGRVRVVDFGLARAISDTTAASDASAATLPAPGESPASDEPEALKDVLVVTGGATWDSEPPAAPATPAPAASGAQRRAAVRLTATGIVMGTPRYMAPEQMRGQTPDQRSDQFSFCVSLFHALYGEWPFEGANALALMRSAAKGQLVVPRTQAEVPPSIRKAILRGLAAAPADRFPDMAALLRVLEARLQRRQRGLWGITAAALVTGSAVAFAAVDRAPEPCAEVTSEIDALWSTARKAALGNAFHGSGQVYADIAWRSTEAAIDEYVAAWRSGARDACEATHVHRSQSAELLDRRMLCLDRGQQRLAALLASFEGGEPSVLAGVVERAFGAASALPDLDVCSDANAMRQGVEPPAEPALASSVAAVRQHLAEARTHEIFGRYDQALQAAEEQRRIAESLPYPPLHAEALYHVALALAGRGNSDDAIRAEATYLDAVDIAEGTRHDPLAAEIWHNLVLLAGDSHSSMERGYTWSRREQAAVRRIGNPAPDQAQALHALGTLYFRDSQHAEAARHQRQAIDILEAAAPRSPRLSGYYHDLANSEYWRGDYAAAGALYERALAHAMEHYGAMHPKVARLQRDFAQMLLDIEELDRARPLLQAALSTWTKNFGAEHFQVGRVHFTLSELEANAGNFEQAREHARKGHAIYDRVVAPDHRHRAEPSMHIGIIELRQGNFEAASEAFDNALRIRRRLLAEGHLLTGWTRYYLGESLIGLERHDAALQQIEVAEGIMARSTSMPWYARAMLLGARGRALLGRGERAPAVEALEQAVALFREHQGFSWERAAALWALARALPDGTDAGARAQALAEEARVIYAARGQAGDRARQAIDDWRAVR